MRIRNKIPEKTQLALRTAFIYIWLTVLSPLANTEAYYSVYLLCALAAAACMWANAADQRTPPQTPGRRGSLVGLSALFSLAVVLANYRLFAPWEALQSKTLAAGAFVGGVCVAEPILQWMLRNLPGTGDARERNHPKRAFFFGFLMISVIDLLYLFFAQYPGILTRDSVSTVRQILGDQAYNNLMPFWHTMAVKVPFDLGMLLFGDINGAIATAHVAQILSLAACVAFAWMTLYQIGVPGSVLWPVLGFYALIPYNIVYSVTMWKDVPFAFSTLLMLTGLYRLLKGVGRKKWVNYGTFTLGAVGFSLMRTNGWFAFAATFLMMLLVLRKSRRTLLSVMGAVLLVTWVMLNPLLDWLGVSGMNYVEAFAVPMQQVARVVSEERELTPEETELLNELFDLEMVRQLYDPNTVDPVKFMCFRGVDADTIRQRGWAYLKLYLSLGLRYPSDYGKAWIDETRGYWNGGYHYWIYTRECSGEEYGVVHSGEVPAIADCYDALFRIWEKMTTLQFTASIGLFVWAAFACFALNIWKRREEMLLCMPLVVILVGLWLGTPVYAEFRYAYPVILSLPLIAGVTAYHPREQF